MYFKLKQLQQFKLIIKKGILLFLIVLMSGCSLTTNEKSTNPNIPIWFSNRTLLKDSAEFIGYGQGNSIEQAMAGAKTDLALSISAKVNYIIEENIQTDGKKSSTQVLIRSRIESNLQLSGIKLIKTQTINNITYSAYIYSNLPVVSKIINAKIDVKCTATTNPYLKHTMLFQSIKQQLFMNGQGCEPQVEVTYKNNTWYLLITSTKNTTHMYPLGEYDLSRLFAKVKNDTVELKASSTSLQEGDFYHFTMQTKERGYLSLIYISGDGQILLLINNQAQTAGNKLVYPNLKFYDGLVAESNKQRYSQDVAILALCKNQIDLSNISQISTQRTDEKNQFQFDQVMQQIQHCKISSELIKVQGK